MPHPTLALTMPCEVREPGETRLRCSPVWNGDYSLSLPTERQELTWSQWVTQLQPQISLCANPF